VEIPLRADDLAPGDREAAARDATQLRVRRIREVSDPDFAVAYDRLFAEFGSRGEMETRAVIRDRLAWDPARPIGRAALAYELLVLRHGGEIAALRDHTAVVHLDTSGRPLPGPLVVHLSHAFVEPAHRGRGLAAWLRALPLQTVRRCAAAVDSAPSAPIVLVAEMEAPDPARPERMPRLRSYQRAGFQKVDPVAAPYAQPDFRAAEAPAGPLRPPIPLALVLRRVGRENESSMPAAELAAVVDAIYAVYAVHIAAAALDPLRAAAKDWTARHASFRLLPPTA
jgi:GNAT superfamily N-acetyltransferase